MERPVPIQIDDDSDMWANMMMSIEGSKNSPELRKIVEERIAPEVLHAAEECTSYEDFKRLLALYTDAATSANDE